MTCRPNIGVIGYYGELQQGWGWHIDGWSWYGVYSSCKDRNYWQSRQCKCLAI